MITLIWSGTIMTSIAISTTKKIQILKKLADNGFKLKQPFFNKKLSNLSIFVPFVNIVKVLKDIKDFDIEISDLIPLSHIEKKLYEQNKSILNILKLNMKTKLDPNRVLIFFENNKENTIYFIKKENEYIITSVKGPISKLNKKLQLEILNNQLKELNTSCDNCIKKNVINNSENIKDDEIKKLKSLKTTLIDKAQIENKQFVYVKRKI